MKTDWNFPRIVALAALLTGCTGVDPTTLENGAAPEIAAPDLDTDEVEAQLSVVKAFPTAEGFGAQTRGAYGSGVKPTVYTVTNLTDPQVRTPLFDGSFRWAAEAPEPRIILFAVAGYIDLRNIIEIRTPYVNIEAQTAPGDGVALRTAPSNGRTLFRVASHDVIVRHLRVRPGLPDAGVSVDTQQAIQVGGSGNVPTYNVIIDHCSATWGIDGNAQTGNEVHDVTFQWNIISEGLNDAGHSKGKHSRGFELYVGDRTSDVNVNGRISVHHNLMSHVQYRVPQISIKNGLTEVINNVVYHTTEFGMSINGNAHEVQGDSKNRIIKNYLLRTATKHGDVWLTSGTLASGGGHLPGVRLFVRGNLGPGRTLTTQPQEWSLGLETTPGCTTCESTTPASARNHLTTDPLCTASDGAFAWPAIRVTQDSALVALAKISGTGTFAGQALVGATRPRRDGVDTRIVGQLVTYLQAPTNAYTVPVPGGPNGGLLDNPAQVGGYPALLRGPLPRDSDADSIPDAWETAHALNPQSPNDAHRVATNGYTNLENYLNERAGDTIP